MHLSLSCCSAQKIQLALTKIALAVLRKINDHDFA
jgi:hypothetical protein